MKSTFYTLNRHSQQCPQVPTFDRSDLVTDWSKARDIAILIVRPRRLLHALSISDFNEKPIS